MSKKEIFINMENEVFKGNLLDIGLDNNGIVYNIYKEFNNGINVEYLSGEDEGKNIKENYYDLCILLFSFGSIWFQSKKVNIIEKIHRCLNENGILYIWDVDKKRGRIFSGEIKILVPGKKLKKVKIKDFNIIHDNSRENTINIIKKFFEIEKCNYTEDIYYIKAKNKCGKQAFRESAITENIQKN